MDIDFNNHIGGYRWDAATEKWSIVGASDKMNEDFSKKMQNNQYTLDDIGKDAVSLYSKKTMITSENYEDIRKPTGTMPTHCYGTTYGYQLREEMKQVLEDYYIDKKGSLEDVKQFFIECCKDMRIALAQERKTTGLDENDNEQIILDTYEQFRMLNSVLSAYACRKEGETLAAESGWRKGQDDYDWVYYNADYYYASEEIRDIMKEAANELASEWGIEKIDTAARDKDNYISYSSSFNEVWQHGGKYGTRTCTMIDKDMEPPKGFTMFYREDFKGKGTIEVGIKGENESIYKKLKLNLLFFDRDLQLKPQFYHLIDLFPQDSNTETAKEFYQYLKNFDIYTRSVGTSLNK